MPTCINAQAPAVSIEEAARRVELIDLGPIIWLLTNERSEHRKYGPGCELSLDVLAADVQRYRQFLTLCTMFPDRPQVPTPGVDRIWHLHALDTAKYRADTEGILETRIDHFPYLGRPEGTEHLLGEKFSDTCVLFQSVFGFPYADEGSEGEGCGGSGCVGGSEYRPEEACMGRPSADLKLPSVLVAV